MKSDCFCFLGANLALRAPPGFLASNAAWRLRRGIKPACFNQGFPGSGMSVN